MLSLAVPTLILSLVATVQARTDREPAEDRCPDGRVSYIFIDNHSIFDTARLDEEGRPFLWAYRAANALHVRTREDFIDGELLFGVGDCLDPFLLEESERLLRAYRFIARADVFAVPQPDGSTHVVVDTQDEWTTKLDVRAGFDEGFRIEGVEVTEENLLGRGVLVGLFYRGRREQRDLGAQLESPRLLGTRWDVRASAGRTRAGSFFSQEFFYPFVGEVGRRAARQLHSRREAYFAYAVPSGAAYSHVLLPVLEENGELTVAGRIGRPGSLAVLGAGITRRTLRYPGLLDRLEIVEAGDFSDTRPADPETIAEVLPQTVARSSTRANLLLGLRSIHFVRRRGLDALGGIQDVRLGSDISFTLGRSLPILEAAGASTPDDVYMRLHAFAGLAPGAWILNSAATVEGRHVMAGSPAGTGWRDVLAEVDLFAYWQPPTLPRHTFFARISTAGGWSTDLPFQLTLGGREGVRGYTEQDFPGGRRILLSAEDRVRLGWPAPDLLDFGLTLFADVGRTWQGRVPFGRNSEWRGAAGAGLRLGFPRGTQGVVRLDLAHPLESPLALRRAIFRLSVAEVLGILPGFRDLQMDRSRAGTGVDLFDPLP